MTETGKPALAGEIVVLPFSPVAEDGVSLIYLLKPVLGLLFPARVGIQVVGKGKLSKGAL